MQERCAPGQLRALARLARMDEAARRIDAELERLPRSLEQLQNDLRRLEQRLEQERRQLAEVEALKASHEKDLQQRQEALTQAKARAARARTARDAESAGREVEVLRRAIREREEELLRLMEAYEQGAERLQAHEKDLETLRNAFQQEEARIREEVQRLQERRAEVLRGREALLAEIGDELVRRYERIRTRRGGVAVAFLGEHDESCTACRMALPPQVLLLVRRGESLHACPACHRLLLYAPAYDVEGGAEPAPPQAALSSEEAPEEQSDAAARAEASADDAS